MLLELLLEVLFIKIRIKGSLENINKNTKEIIDVFGIKTKQNINYITDNTKYQLTIDDNKVILVRKNENFIHKFIFELGKEKESEYYIKEYNTSIKVSVLTKELNITNNKIEIIYQTIDNNDEYKYVLEMENKL